MSVLLTFGGQQYFIDFLNIDTVLSSGSAGLKGGLITETKTTTFKDFEGKETTTVEENEVYKSKEVDGFRYETIREMISIILENNDEDDGITNLNSKSISFKLAFNTLIEYGILNIAE